MYRPMAMIRVRASTSKRGKLAQFVYRNVSASINLQRGYTDPSNPEDTGALAGAVGLPYVIPNKRIEFVALQPCNVPLGYWRSVGESYNTFAVESAMDELALASGVDPMAFRKTALSGANGNPRMLATLKAVETLSKWATAPAAGHARGVAMLSGFGSYIAVVADVTKSLAGEIKVNNFYAAIDCGTVVNPGQVTYQMQGGLLHGLSAAMWHGQTFNAGKAAITNFNRYPIIKLNAAPTIAVQIVTSTEAPGGVGETGVPCVAPAIANAWAKLTGTRLRALPFYPGRRMGDD
jgi:isoquinoline 1-oxidoreductase beta subunit